LLRYVGEITPPATLQTGRTSGPSSSRRWEKHVCRIWGRHYVRPFIRTKAIKKPRTEPGLKFTFQRGTNRCLHNGPEYDARYNCSRSIKRRCQDFSHVAVQKSCSGTNRPSEPETSAARSSLALTFSAGGDGGRRSPEIPTQSVDPNAAVMACEVSRPTRTTLLRRKPNFALSKSPLPSRLPRRRVLRRLFPN
jgi:hypothetical protein